LIYDTSYEINTNWESFNLALGLFLKIKKRLGQFYLKGGAGYEAHIAMDLFNGDPEYKYLTSSGETVKVNANGLRLDLGVGYTLFTRKAK
jgi:hypothetical protein